jgi:hypothetical protein
MGVRTRIHKAAARRIGRIRKRADEIANPAIAPEHPDWNPKTPVFAVGTGRCGTHFLCEVLGSDPGIFSLHTHNAEADSFARYCIWNELPVDMEAYLQDYQRRVDQATSHRQILFEANPYLALSIPLIRKRFNAKFIFIVRGPEGVVNSHVDKGWYETSPIVGNPDLALGFQPGALTSLTFGRIIPRGEEYSRWEKLTRVGKLAWMWNTVNQRIWDDYSRLPEGDREFVKLEDLDYDRYVQLHRFSGGLTPLAEPEYGKLTSNPPGKGPRKHRSADWTTSERSEFLQETEEMRKTLNYEISV